jgi:hypothetical protein
MNIHVWCTHLHDIAIACGIDNASIIKNALESIVSLFPPRRNETITLNGKKFCRQKFGRAEPFYTDSLTLLHQALTPKPPLCLPLCLPPPSKEVLVSLALLRLDAGRITWLTTLDLKQVSPAQHLKTSFDKPGGLGRYHTVIVTHCFSCRVIFTP